MPTDSGSQNAGDAVLGDHPQPPSPFAETLSASDAKTQTGVAHRALIEIADRRESMVAALRQMVETHHSSAEALERSRRHHEAMARLGFAPEQSRLKRYPTSPTTQKGNLAEVVLAEYVRASSALTLPVYRLRFNPNVDQSMKGDDVLAFDLDADPVRIVVGEAKFRATSTVTAVNEIVAALGRSVKGGVPTSLQFVADRLFEEGHAELGGRVMQCALLFARGLLRLDYVGLLVSDTQASARVHSATTNSVRRLAMISLNLDDPDGLVGPCFAALE